MTWIASATTDEDRVVAAEGSSEVGARRARARRVPRLLQRRREPDALVHPARAVGTRPAPGPRRGVPCGLAGLRDGQPRCSRTRVVAELDNNPDAAVLFHDYHLYLAPGYVRAARPDAKLAHFVHIPWPVDWTILPDAMRRAVHDGLLANDVVAFHTARWARNFEASCAEIIGGSRHARTSTHHPISIDTGEFDELAQSHDVLARERELEARRPEKLIAARRPHRSVEEHRARPRGVRRPARHASRVARPRADARAARSVATVDPRVRRVRRGDRADDARTVNARHPGAIELQRRRRLPAVGRGVQAVRRPARERGLRRHEPRREGGAARQRARRRARPVRERGRARGARASGR